MALFKFRKGGDEPRAAAGPGESIEAMRRRARHRLIGAVVLVLAGVIGFPLVFDTQPRPVDVDIPIEIPDRQKVRPLGPPVAAGASQGPAAAASAVGAAPTSGAAPTPASASKTAATPAAPAASAATVAAAKPALSAASATATASQGAASRPAAADKPEPRKAETILTETREEAGLAKKPNEDAARARALLEGKTEGKTADAAAAEGRFVVQVGAFAEQVKAREARMKLERAGIKTYTNVAETPGGRRIRVRAGPFANRAEADRAAQKIKGLDLPAAILTL